MDWWLFLLKNKIKGILGKDRMYKCEYCGVYHYKRVVFCTLYFCCDGCKNLHINELRNKFKKQGVN